MRVTRFAVVVVFLATVVSQAKCATVYTQPSDFPAPSYYYSNDGLGSQVYDNFTLGTTETITGVSWVGSFNAGTVAAISDFRISFWTNDSSGGGEPGSLILSQTIAGDAGQASLGLDLGGNPTFTYSLILPTSFAATSGTTYWMSIVATTSNWAWHTGTGGDGVGKDDFPGLGRISTPDMAFSLSTTEGARIVPEPTSLALAGFAGLGIAVRAWRRRRQRTA